MALFSLHHAGMPNRSGSVLTPPLRQMRHALRVIHRWIVAAKMRRLRSELLFRAGYRDDWAEREEHGMKSLRRPQTVREKWDY